MGLGSELCILKIFQRVEVLRVLAHRIHLVQLISSLHYEAQRAFALDLLDQGIEFAELVRQGLLIFGSGDHRGSILIVVVCFFLFSVVVGSVFVR